MDMCTYTCFYMMPATPVYIYRGDIEENFIYIDITVISPRPPAPQPKV